MYYNKPQIIMSYLKFMEHYNNLVIWSVWR